MVWRKNRKYGAAFVRWAVGAGIMLAVLFIGIEVRTSLFLSARERITIGVFARYPYVISFEKTTGIAHIVYFDPDAYVKIPGGYGWYRLRSINLLGAIEQDQNTVIKHTFEQLIGAPVDMVVYPRKGEIDAYTSQEDFMEFFLRERNKLIPKYAVSTSNLIDIFMLRASINTSPNRLVTLSAFDAYLLRRGKKYYEPSSLDSLLKGFFYQQKVLDEEVQVIVVTDEKFFSAAYTLSRIIEGTGMKVADIRFGYTGKKCTIKAQNTDRFGQKLVSEYLGCATIETKENALYLYLGQNMAKLYK